MIRLGVFVYSDFLVKTGGHCSREKSPKRVGRKPFELL
jgi:hypothetical protein